MSTRRPLPLWHRFAAWCRARFAPRPALPDEWQQAADLVAAVDRGGVPLNPARVNAVARALGLEVSRHAPVEATVARLRAALAARRAG